jgi:hypothetical protein
MFGVTPGRKKSACMVGKSSVGDTSLRLEVAHDVMKTLTNEFDLTQFSP